MVDLLDLHVHSTHGIISQPNRAKNNKNIDTKGEGMLKDENKAPEGWQISPTHS
jgi:hypothetical protein